MAQPQQKQKQPQDLYAQRAKQLASTVQRLRGWVGSDPSRNAELGDALIEVTGYRLLGHAYADAASEAQEAVVLAGKLLAEQGPIGPYTPVPAAVRYFTAAVHLAVIQAGAGLPDAAERTMQAALDWQEQLRRHQSLDDQLSPQTAVWALSVQARAGLAAGEVERANAYADAALDRLIEGGLADVADSYLPMDTQRLVADSRWAAGRIDQALAHDELAREQYERVAAGRLANPGRLSPALLARLAEPLFGLYRVIADRLVAGGDVDRGLVIRRALIETLGGLTKRLGEPATAQLARSLDDLAADLVLAGRADEADLAAEEARKTAGRLTGELADVRNTLGSSADRADRRPGRVEPLTSWPALDDTRSFAASTAGARGARPTADEEAELLRQAQARAEAERAEAHRLEEQRRARAREEHARRETERAEAAREARELAEAERRAAEQAAAERAETERIEAERLAAEEEAARLEIKRRREERLEAHRLEEARLAAEQQEAERREAERREVDVPAGEQPLDPAEAERRELERLAEELAELERTEAEQAERERRAAEEAEAERAEQERQVAERLAGEREEAEQAERERRAAESERAERERAEREQAEQERAEQERAEQERAEQERAVQERAVQERAVQERAASDAALAETSAPALSTKSPTEPASTSQAATSEERSAPEPAAPEPTSEAARELDVAIGEWQAAKAAGERRRARAANERVVDLLRPKVEEDPRTYGPQLIDALEQLSSIRLRTGDIFGARGPSREAKALAKTLGS
jgi:hypothetical protein